MYDFQIYEEIRSLAKEKFDLNMINVILSHMFLNNLLYHK